MCRRVRQTSWLLTEVLDGLLVSVALHDVLLVLLALGNGSLERGVPSVTLSITASLEGVLVSGNLERELVRGVLLEVVSIGQAQDFLRVALLGLGLDHVEETSAGVAGPGGDWLGGFWLGAAEVVGKALVGDGFIADPEVSLAEDELPEPSCQYKDWVLLDWVMLT